MGSALAQDRQLVLRAPKLDLKVVMALEGLHAHALHMPCL